MACCVRHRKVFRLHQFGKHRLFFRIEPIDGNHVITRFQFHVDLFYRHGCRVALIIGVRIRPAGNGIAAHIIKDGFQVLLCLIRHIRCRIAVPVLYHVDHENVTEIVRCAGIQLSVCLPVWECQFPMFSTILLGSPPESAVDWLTCPGTTQPNTPMVTPEGISVCAVFHTLKQFLHTHLTSSNVH